ncbi:hypothetical protein [Streptomyces griseocarneus]|uniref:hypothetical protein n=1 Tax=Streptomyces griseocarneus TaxID=51201 RepID=UPI00167EDE6D|nr:hypothetical protein [Streptomyces griseocarneus]MBZ6475762.1 hypothetical protein [Streptomyces griseocarneus]GHG50912.1 hypothetical protein GCM10018779_11440 [Streptomyces griseocarneus]
MAGEDKILHVRVTAADTRALRNLLRDERLDVGGGPAPTPGPGEQRSIEAYVTEEKALGLEREDVAVHVLGDATAIGRARQEEVGTGDRYADPGTVPQGLGQKVKDRSREG